MLAAELVMLMLPVAPAALTDVNVTLPGALNPTAPEVAVMPPPNAPMLEPAVIDILAALSVTVFPSLREIEPAVAVRSRLPTAVMELLAPLPPPSLTLRSILPPALRLMPPLVTVAMLAVEAMRRSRPAVALMAACVASNPVLVADTSPSKLMSLAAPAAVSAISPLEAVRLPRVMAAALPTVTEVPALMAPVETPAPALIWTAPSVAVSASVVMVELALRMRPPVVATIGLPVWPMVVPAVIATDLPFIVTALPSDLEMEVPAERSRLPAAVNELVAPLPPPSLTLRSMAPAALSLMAPDVLVVRLAVEAILMSRPEASVMPAAESARPAWLESKLPLRTRSLAPTVARRIVPVVV